MPLGYDSESRIVYLGDTAELYAYLSDREDDAIPVDDLLGVVFTIQMPDGTRLDPIDGEIQDDGSGFLRYEDTTQQGEYVVVATFTLVTGEKRSTRSDFQVANPFNGEVGAVGTIDGLVWQKFQDLFDAADGGPWLRDMTLNVFSPNRIGDFVPDALFEINVYNPPTHFGYEMFVLEVKDANGNVIEARENENTNILVLGTQLAIIRHLMRSYTEQPLPTGGQITYEDRRDYLQRWGTIYQIEFQRYDGLLKLWKRQFLSLNQGKTLVSSKAGRLLPAPLRSRNIGRGYY